MARHKTDEHYGKEDCSPLEVLRNQHEHATETASSSQAQGGTAPRAPSAETKSLSALREETDDLRDYRQRVAADYLNYQKRIQRELQRSRDFANEELIKALLPVLDDMDSALETGAATLPEEHPFLIGLRLVQDKTMAILGRFGLTVIDSLDRPFNPDYHCAVASDSSGEHAPNIVVKELRRGYALQGRTIRPATVVVSVASGRPSPSCSCMRSGERMKGRPARDD